MKLEKLGEIGLIDMLSSGFTLDRTVVKGIGDDAAVIRWKKNRYLLLSTDMLIEGVHFDITNSSPFDIGWKALGVGVSDIAAMGGQPRYALFSIGLPRRLSSNFVKGIYKGIKSLAERFGVNIVGGDTNSSERIIIDTGIIGQVFKDELTLRSGAKAGDIIAVTGRLGGSIKGKHLRFLPRLRESTFLVKNFKINSMIDVSDGLSSDLRHICKQSRVGARIYESLIPISKIKGCSVDNALNDGEDFELLFTVTKETFGDLARSFKRRFSTPITAIGEMTEEDVEIELIKRDGRIKRLKEEGFRHF